MISIQIINIITINILLCYVLYTSDYVIPYPVCRQSKTVGRRSSMNILTGYTEYFHSSLPTNTACTTTVDICQQQNYLLSHTRTTYYIITI